MEPTGEVRVSRRGQMSLPAEARHRWQLDDGGTVGFVDLGDAVLLVPGGVAQLRRQLLDAVDDEALSAARRGFGDPELADG